MKNYQNKAVDKNTGSPTKPIPSVQDYMTRDLITFKKDMDINMVIKSLLDNNISGAPVLDDSGKVIGMIDDKDCLKVLFGDIYNRIPTSDTVSTYMSDFLKLIPSTQNILEVATTFLNSRYERLLILDENKTLIGQISRRDILRAIQELN